MKILETLQNCQLIAFDSPGECFKHLQENPRRREVCRVIVQPSKGGQFFRLIAEYPTEQDARSAAQAALAAEAMAVRMYRRALQSSPVAAGRRLDRMRQWLADENARDAAKAAEKAKEQLREIPGL